MALLPLFPIAQSASASADSGVGPSALRAAWIVEIRFHKIFDDGSRHGNFAVFMLEHHQTTHAEGGLQRCLEGVEVLQKLQR